MSPCRIVLFLIMCIHIVCGSEEHVTGYLGQPVVLKSGVDRSWNLIKVQWSIYQNTTYIASLKDGKVTIFKFWRHQGRLELNTTTGDLTIKNVTMDDSMIYNVALVNSNNTRKKVEVHLTVQEQLKPPKIQKMVDSFKDGQCHVALNCTASDQNVNLSWTPDAEFNGSYISGNAVDSSLVIFMSFSGKGNITVNCTASSGQQTETKQTRVRCSEEKQSCEAGTVSSSCSSCALPVIFAIVVTAVIALAYAFRESIKDALPADPFKFFRNLCDIQSRDEGKTRHNLMGQDTKKDKHTSFV